MTQIEEFLFCDRPPCLLKAFAVSQAHLILEFLYLDVSPSTSNRGFIATFANAVIEYTERYENKPEEWPLDPMGFHATQFEAAWRFVLHCESIEWGWTSAWPVLSPLLPDS